MLSFEQKLTIIESFPQLERKDVSLGRINFHYEDSAHEKKSVIYHLHPNGNGYVFAGLLKGIATDNKGLVNIREYSEAELRSLIEQSIASLAIAPPEKSVSSKKTKKRQQQAQEEKWIGPDHATLTLVFEEEHWYVYSGNHLESAFETYEEAEQYMEEEEFTRA